MNRKIYFNDKYIEFVETQMQSSPNQLIKTFDLTSKKENNLKSIVNDFLNEKNLSSIQIFHPDYEKIFNELKALFYYIEAAGGLIEKDNRFLFIHRHGRWDLPKGKLEKGETIKEAAIRECEEECGIKNLNIIKPLNSTFHIYQYKNGYALKQSYWFYMQTDYSEKLTPQIEESIDEVKWFNKNEINTTILSDTYYTISDVTREGVSV